MKDRALATIELINAAEKVAKHVDVQQTHPMTDVEAMFLNVLKRAVEEYKETKQAKYEDEKGDEPDSFWGTG